MHNRIEKLIDAMDWEAVHVFMRLTNWTWYGKGVPSVDDLRRTARSLLYDVMERAAQRSRGTVAEIGGLRAEFEPGEEDDGLLELEFVCRHSN